MKHSTFNIRRPILNAGLPLAALLSILFALPVMAQTNTPPATNPPIVPPPIISLDWATNIMQLVPMTSFQDAKIGLGAGALLRHGQVENAIKGDFYLHTNFMFSAEVQNGPAQTVIDSLSLAFGYRVASTNYEAGFQIMGRRNWSTDPTGNVKPGYQAGFDLNASWKPVTDGRLNPYICNRFLSPDQGSAWKDKWQYEIEIGLKAVF
jgi:hypothetical protein